MTNEELIFALHKAYDAMFFEYMDCPWCWGHIGYRREYHTEGCIWLKIPSLEYLERVHPRPQIPPRLNVEPPRNDGT
ncbi:MAG TPA: hypothetical protein VJA25_02225 [Dehalococcoidia bacterium]|nr:hypothetical protein [Dehalococcoidia bacterium]